jgi:hypothetical protein
MPYDDKAYQPVIHCTYKWKQGGLKVVITSKGQPASALEGVLRELVCRGLCVCLYQLLQGQPHGSEGIGG